MGINNYGTECLLSGLPILTNNKISTDIFGDLLVKKYYKPLDDSINANKLYDNIIILPCNLSITTNILIYLSRILEPICE